MMKWVEIKRWAKDHGYVSFREKTTHENNPNDYDYYWGKEDDPSVSGVSYSVSKLATDIYNHMTDNIWVEYQQQVQEEKKNKEIDHGQGYSF